MLKTLCSRDKHIVISFAIMITTVVLLVGTVLVYVAMQYQVNYCPLKQWLPKLRNIYQHNGYWVISNFVQNEKWETRKCDTHITYAVQGDYVDIYKLEELYSNGFEEYTSFAVYIPNSEYMIQSRIAIAYVRHCLYYNSKGLKVPNTSIRKYVSFHLYFSYDEKLPFDSLSNNGFEDFIALTERDLSCSDVKEILNSFNAELFTHLVNLTYERSNYLTVGKNIAQLEAHTNYILNGDLNYYPCFFMSTILKLEIYGFLNQHIGMKIEYLIWYIPVILNNLQRPYNAMARTDKYQLLKTTIDSKRGLNTHKGDPFNITGWLENTENNYEIFDFSENYAKFLEYKTFYIVDADFPLLDESAELTVDQSENLRMYTLQLLNYEYVESVFLYLLHTVDADDLISHNQFDSIDEGIRLEYKYAYDGRLERYGNI